MIDSTLRAVAGEAAAGVAELVVEHDAGSEAQQPAADPGAEALKGAGAVLFQAELAFQAPEHAFDPLPDRGEAQLPGGGRLVLAARSADGDPVAGSVECQLAAGIALVADHGVGVAGQPRQQLVAGDVAFLAVGGD